MAFGRVLSGTARVGQTIRVLGESYSLDDEEDMAVRDILSLSIPQARYRIEVNKVPAGNLILLEGVDDSFAKTATVTVADNSVEVCIFRPLQVCMTSAIGILIGG